jgi:hypothetical protein
MLPATSAFRVNKRFFAGNKPVMVAGAQLAPGYYTFQWNNTTPDVELTIKDGRKITATVAPKMVPLDHPYDHNALVVNDANRNLVEIRLSGKKFMFEVEQSANMGASRGDQPAH